MPEFLELKPRSEALEIFLKVLPQPPLKIETIPTMLADGRVLAGDIVSEEMSPPFSRSTVDGYAVRAAETFGASDSLPVYLRLAGEIAMGRPAGEPLPSGSVMLIHTGGMLPPGADAVIMLEDTQRVSDSEVELCKSVAAGENIISAGEDARPGDVVLPGGSVLGPAQMGGLLALGILQVPVVIPPLVGILSSGDEVIPPDRRPQPGQIRDINSYSLQALFQRSGVKTKQFGIAPDEAGAFEAIMRRAFAECDMLVVTAGSSASARDLTAAAIRKLGQPGVLVHGVRLRPGKPTILAVCDGKPVIGLPGNPVSALVVASLFALPALEKLMGVHKTPALPVTHARLTNNVPSVAGREDFLPVKLISSLNGWQAEPIFFKSNMIFTLAKCDGLLHVPADAVGLSAGEIVEIVHIL